MKKNPDITVHEKAGLNIGYLNFNVTKPPFDNVKVRQALSYAVNKQAIMDAVYQGTGQIAKTQFHRQCGLTMTILKIMNTILKKPNNC